MFVDCWFATETRFVGWFLLRFGVLVYIAFAFAFCCALMFGVLMFGAFGGLHCIASGWF